MNRANLANQGLARTITIGVGFGADSELGWTLADPERHFDTCKEVGFTAVRLAVVWAAHAAAEPPYLLDPRVLSRVAGLAQAAIGCGLAVVVDNHLDPALMADPAAHRDRLLAGTRQVVAHFGPFDDRLVIEPLAEPHGALDPLWNTFLADVVQAVRDVDPLRSLLVGPAFYNTVLRLEDLVLPDDDHLILAIHQYWPIPFTMQGEDWFKDAAGWEWLRSGPADWIGTTWNARDDEVSELTAGYDRVAAFASAHVIPVSITEFGASVHADAVSRATWARTNRELAEARKFSWGWWSLAPSFAIFEPRTGEWDRSLLAALIPNRKEESQ